MKFRNVALASTAAVIAAVAIGSGAAQATSLITGHDVKDGSIHRADLGAGINHRLERVAAPDEQGLPGKDGVNGADGKDGKNAYAGAYYSVAFYDAGDTNAGAIATVACQATTDSAVAGGVQTLGLDVNANSRNTPVSSSFPGRMDWATNTPKANRVDGWIVQFGGNNGIDANAPEKVKVWALCMPDTDVKVVQTYQQSIDG